MGVSGSGPIKKNRAQASWPRPGPGPWGPSMLYLPLIGQDQLYRSIVGAGVRMGETSLKDLTTGSETKFEEACPEKYVKACFEEDAEVIRAATPEAILKLAATLQNLVNVGMKLPGSLGTSCPLCSSRGQGIFGPGAGGPGRLQPRPARTRTRGRAHLFSPRPKLGAQGFRWGRSPEPPPPAPGVAFRG